MSRAYKPTVKTPPGSNLVEKLEAIGFAEWGTGGGCAMMRKELGNGFFIGITDGNAGLPSYEDRDDPVASVFLACDESFNEGSICDTSYDTWGGVSGFDANFWSNFPMPEAVIPTTRIRCTMAGCKPDTLTWDAFTRANADSQEMLNACYEALSAGKPYAGGGGAAPAFLVEVAS